MSNEPILIWSFYEAPEEYRAMSGHGGDEDWVALLPASYAQRIPMFLDSGTPFGVCEVSEHPLDDGRLVLIGAHA